MTTTAEALTALTDSNNSLVGAINFSKSSLDADIAAAVAVSENATQVPLASVVANIVNMQTSLINYIAGA
tara:strand:- start:1904 stop:2113 length:210 start_codon:yes stop_codon:yes gene_type:complete